MMPVPLLALQSALSEFAAGSISANQVAQACRKAKSDVEKLPAAYGRVLDDIADRLESGAMFSEESCSFSQNDLINELSTWLAKAQEKLAATQQLG
jgi:exonuclease VII small subunit